MRVTVFWLIGPGAWTQQIVDEQVGAMRQSGLLARASQINVWAQDYSQQDRNKPWSDLLIKHPDAAAKAKLLDFGPWLSGL